MSHLYSCWFGTVIVIIGASKGNLNHEYLCDSVKTQNGQIPGYLPVLDLTESVLACLHSLEVGSDIRCNLCAVVGIVDVDLGLL